MIDTRSDKIFPMASLLRFVMRTSHVCYVVIAYGDWRSGVLLQATEPRISSILPGPTGAGYARALYSMLKAYTK